MHFMIVSVEGFEFQKFLTQCVREGISVYRIRLLGDMEMILRIKAEDWIRFQKIAGNRYRITILSENGAIPLAKRILSKKSMLTGVVFFLLLVYYQSCFISEIRIYGYERLTERQIRENLAAAGLYEGCSKKLDPDGVEIQMFRTLPDISWIGITYRGNLAEVTLVEGTLPEQAEDSGQPCHVVAAKEGYIQRIIAREGKEEVTEGQFVREGDVLISGILPIEDKTYKRDPEGTGSLTRFVHASGEVYARTIYRFTAYQEAYETRKEPTGRILPGISIAAGDFSFSTADFFRPYDAAVYEEKALIDQLRPIPLRICINRQKEVTLSRIKRDGKALEDMGKQQARAAIRENIPESVEILNKSLKFYPEENIIRVIIMVEALEEIGKTRAFGAPEEGT